MMKRLTLFVIALSMISTALAVADSSDEIKATGPIQDYSSTHITVSDKTFAIDSSTEFENGGPSDMAVGVFVEVEGEYKDDTLTADKIEFKEDDDDSSKEVHEVGMVTDVSGDTFTVNGKVFNITGETQFDHGNRGDLVVGVRVKVEGYKNTDGYFAKEVEFMDSDDGSGGGGRDDDDDVEIKGVVTSVGNDSFAVGGSVFDITARTRFIRMSQADLIVGIFVEVEGTSSHEALKVKREDDDDDDHGTSANTGVLASVASVGDELLELVLEDGSMLLTDEDTRLSGRHGLKSTAKDLIPGLTVRLQFKNSMSLSEGERDEATHLSVIGTEEVKGVVSGVASPSVMGSIIVGGKEVKYDKRTIVQGDTKAEDPDEIPEGTYVVALSNPLADGSFLANRIIVTDEDDDDPLGRKVKFFGTVSALSGGAVLDGFSIGEQFFAVDADTVFNVKGCDEPFDPSLLAEGMSVRVIAFQDGSGGYNAVNVNVQLPMFKFTGYLDAISATALSILGMDIEITGYTDFDDVAPGDLGVGSYVEVKAVLWPDDSMIACEIELEDEGDEEFEVQGVISEKSIDGDNVLISVGGLTVVVEPGTGIRSKNSMLDVDDLAVGVEVQVSGYIVGGDYLANHIKVR